MTRQEKQERFLARTDTAFAKRRETAKKVAALLAESAATMPEVERIFEQAKRYLTVQLPPNTFGSEDLPLPRDPEERQLRQVGRFFEELMEFVNGKTPGVSREPIPRGGEAKCDALAEAEEVLDGLFRQAGETKSHGTRILSALSTFGRLLEKEKHSPAPADAAVLHRLATGLYDGSINVRVESREDGTTVIHLFDTIRRANAGRAIVKRMGDTHYVQSADLTPL